LLIAAGTEARSENYLRRDLQADLMICLRLAHLEADFLASVQCLLWPEFILVMRQIIHYSRAAPDVYEPATAGMNATQGEFMCVYSAFFHPSFAGAQV